MGGTCWKCLEPVSKGGHIKCYSILCQQQSLNDLGSCHPVFPRVAPSQENSSRKGSCQNEQAVPAGASCQCSAATAHMHTMQLHWQSQQRACISRMMARQRQYAGDPSISSGPRTATSALASRPTAGSSPATTAFSSAISTCTACASVAWQDAGTMTSGPGAHDSNGQLGTLRLPTFVRWHGKKVQDQEAYTNRNLTKLN